MGFVSEISWPEMKSIAGKDDRGVKEDYMLHFKRVAYFRNKLYPNKSIRDTSHFIVLISQFLENHMFSIEMDPCM